MKRFREKKTSWASRYKAWQTRKRLVGGAQQLQVKEKAACRRRQKQPGPPGFLELVFPPYSPEDWPVDGHPAIVDWRDTVHWLHGQIDAPAALTIRVVFADILQNPAACRSRTTKDEGKQIVRGYMHVIRPLGPLLEHDRLAALYVQAAFPWAWPRDVGLRQLLEPGDWWFEELARQERRLKERLERIPGCEAIVDSRNKLEPGRSAWQTWYDVDWYDC